MAHTCHAIACDRPIKREYLMCPRHWRMVPVTNQIAVLRTYRVGQCDDLRPSQEYLDAAKASVIAVAEKEGRVVTGKERELLLYDMLQVNYAN